MGETNVGDCPREGCRLWKHHEEPHTKAPTLTEHRAIEAEKCKQRGGHLWVHLRPQPFNRAVCRTCGEPGHISPKADRAALSGLED